MKVAVIGLGRFGMEVARQLGRSRTEVIAIDRSSQLVDAIKDEVDLAVRLDTTVEGALAGQGLAKVDACVIAIGENFDAALLTTVLAKKLGVPRIICRAQTPIHAEIFRQIGADEVIQPETHAGAHLARRLANPHLVDVVLLADDHALIEVEAPAQFCNKQLKELDLRRRYQVNLVAIRRLATKPAAAEQPITRAEDPSVLASPGTAESIISVPGPDDPILPGDTLVIVGSNEALKRLPT